MGVMINYYREHLHPSARSHYAILKGGKAPNVVPDFAKAWFYVRGGTREMVDEMTKGKAYPSSIPADVSPPVLPDPYENPDWTPGDLDYPTWCSFVWEELPEDDDQPPK